MAKAPGLLWLSQARSDFEASQRFDDADPAMFCHAIAKYQQCVEKAIKGLVAALRTKGIVNAEPVAKHDLEHELSVLMHIPFKPDNQDITAKVSRLMNIKNREAIRGLCALAPQKPEGIGLQLRNTEYPFQRDDGSWLIPSDLNAFAIEERQRFFQTANLILSETSRILTVLLRM